LLKFPGNLAYLRLYDKSATNLSVRYMCLMAALICTYYVQTSMKNINNLQITTQTVQYIFHKGNLNTVQHNS